MNPAVKIVGGALLAVGAGVAGMVGTNQDNAAAAKKYNLTTEQVSVMEFCVKDLDTHDESYFADGKNDHEVCACIAKGVKTSKELAFFFDYSSENYGSMARDADAHAPKFEAEYQAHFGKPLISSALEQQIKRSIPQYERAEEKCVG